VRIRVKEIVNMLAEMQDCDENIRKGLKLHVV
jgi:hypothetical protein